MKTQKMINVIFILALVFVIAPWNEELYGQRYKNSLGIHYGLFQYNTSQNSQLPDTEGGFLNAGLSYKYIIGRYSSVGVTGRLYDWQLNDFQALKTQSLESKWLIHVGRISNSWRVNLITPYVGAGIGYEMHTLTENETDFTYKNAYIPIEAGFFFNLGSKWSLGVFAEYKLSTESDLKTRLGLENSYPAVINSAGITLGWQFGQRKTELEVPVVSTNPFFVQSDDKKPAKEITDAKDAMISDTLSSKIDSIPTEDRGKVQMPDSLDHERKLPVIIPKVVNPYGDTLRIPVILDFSVKGMKEDKIRSLTFYGQAPVDSLSAEAKIDSLLRLTHNLMQRIAILENPSNGRLTQGLNATTLPTITGQSQQQPQQFQQPQQPRQIYQPSPYVSGQVQQSAHKPIVSAPAVTTTPDRNAFATKNDIETLRAEIRNLSAENREALRLLNQNITVRGTSSSPGHVEPQTSAPDTLKQAYPDSEILGDDFYMMPDSIAERVDEDQVERPQVSEQKQQLRLDSLQTTKENLAEELRVQKEQNLLLNEEIIALALLIEERQAEENDFFQYTIYFDVNSAEVASEQINKLEQIATRMLENPDLKVQLSGYADGTGDSEYNAMLSRWRVKAVREELIKAGIQHLRIFEQYFGSKKATGGLNPDERKVEIIVFYY